MRFVSCVLILCVCLYSLKVVKIIVPNQAVCLESVVPCVILDKMKREVRKGVYLSPQHDILN